MKLHVVRTHFSVLVFLGISLGGPAAMSAGMCADVFGSQSAVANGQSTNQQKLLEIIQSIETQIKNEKNPFENLTFEMDEIRQAHSKLAREFPLYGIVLKNVVQKTMTAETHKKLSGRVMIFVKNVHRLNALQKFALVECLRMLSETGSELAIKEMHQDMQNKKTETSQEQQESQQKQKDKKPKVPKDPWQEREDVYKPHNKDVSNSDSDGEKAEIILLTTADVSKGLYADSFRDMVNLQGVARSATSRPEIKSTVPSKEKMIIRPFGKGEIPIPLPSGYVPKTQKNADFEIVQVAPGEFNLRVFNKTLSDVEFPLEKINSYEGLTAQHLKVYLAKSGIKLEDWPMELQSKIQDLLSQKKSPLEVAAELEKFISTEASFLYYSKGNQLKAGDLQAIDQKFDQYAKVYPEPVALAHAGAFNCDGAAWMGALILREYFNIPTRVVSGRGSKDKANHQQQLMNVITSTGIGHAWLEIFVNGQWHPFDLTPTKNPPEMSGSKSEDIIQDKESDQQQQSKQDQKNDSSKSQKQEMKKSEEKVDDKEEAAEQKQESPSDQHSRVISKDDMLKSVQSSLPADRILDRLTFEQINKYHLQQILEEGSPVKAAELLNKHLNNLQKDDDYGVYVKHTANEIQNLIYSFSGVKVQKIKPWLMSAQSNLMRGNIEDAWNDLHSIKTLVTQVNKGGKLSKSESDLLMQIDRILVDLKQYRHPNAAQHKVVMDFYKHLPGNVSRRMIVKTYGQDALTLGSPAQTKLAADLTQGKLNRYLLMSLLNRYADFILNPEIINQWAEQKTLQRSPVPRKNNNDLILTRNPHDFQRMILNPTPGEHIFAKTFEGKQFALGSREVFKTPDPKKPLERKVSVLLYDLSGSMSGDKVKIQDALMMAFIDKALSEVDSFGKPIHEVILYAFHEEVMPPEHIKTVDEAERYLQSKMFKASESSKGTDIEKALVQFYHTVADFAKDKGKNKMPLDRANLILLTDGEATVNPETVAEAKALVPKNIRLYLNFLGIQSSNKDLEQLARESNTKSQQSMVKILDSGTTNEILNQAQSPELDPEAFATVEKKASAKTMQLMSQLLNVQIDFKNHSYELEISKLQAQLASVKYDPESIRKKHLTELKRITTMLLAQTQFDRELRQQIVYQLLQVYPGYSGRALSRLTITEYDYLNDLANWALK